ncbi:acyltransferase family protein [Mameliella sediminis]|uniref:acyltransferase family protein n=1 Tax=Mameliella sediminis TaxID=2836866 RepID=UPI001C450121|nr:acyltransferase family protein [Mameliella sediminis]MBV7394530.1 acyltransferase [Mameliella sediminis]
MKYQPHIDGLRTVAVVPVIAFHAAHDIAPGGFIGVDVFFVISGFLITSLLLSDLESGKYTIAEFYERRARRILPALLFVVACSSIAALALLPANDLRTFGLSVTATMTFVSNMFFWREIDYFANNAELNPLLHTWSLAVEEQFYIFYPLALAFIFKFGRRVLLISMVAVGILSFGLTVAAMDISPSAAFYLFPLRAWELLIGAVAVFFFRPAGSSDRPVLDNLLSALGLLAILLSIAFLDESQPFPGLLALPACAGTALVILFARPGTLVHAVLTRKWMVLLGLISYSAYLWHQPLIVFYKHVFPDDTIGVIVAAVATFPMAFLSWKYIEQPFRKKTSGLSRAQVLKYASVSLAGFALLGLSLTANNGWEFRHSPAERKVLSSFIDGKDYVPGRFNALRGRAFPDDTAKPKILVIGDSYGQDLVNAIYEIGLDKELELSTYHISARCGNLMLEDLATYQDAADRRRCAKASDYDDPRLAARLRQADQVWLVSSWNAWSAPLLPASLDAMAKATDARIVVFGRKHFGLRSTHRFFSGGVAALVGERDLPLDLAEVSREMSQTIPPHADYVDLQKLLCASYETCTNADADGTPLTFDGTHLTPEGARHMGALLRPVLDQILSAQVDIGTDP